MKKGVKICNDGLTAECRYYRRHKDRILAKKAAERVAHPEKFRKSEASKDKEKEQKRLYRAANKEKIARYFADNKERFLANKKAKYAANKEQISEARRKRYAEDKQFADAIKAEMKKHYAENTEKRKARTRAWAAANPEKVRLQGSTKRARKRNAGGKLSAGIAAKLMKLQRGKCPVCRCDLTKENYHLDHIEPISRGGAHEDKNMQLLCKSCNMSKHAKPPIEFMQSRGFLL